MHDDILVSLRVTGRSPMRSQYWFSSRIEEIDNDCVIIINGDNQQDFVHRAKADLRGRAAYCSPCNGRQQRDSIRTHVHAIETEQARTASGMSGVAGRVVQLAACGV